MCRNLACAKQSSEIFQFLLDYYGPSMYDQYTSRFDVYPNRPATSGLQATTANHYYGFKRGFDSMTLEHVAAKILSLVAGAEENFSSRSSR